MRQTGRLFAVLAVTCAVASADDITLTTGLKYSNVVVAGVEDYQMTFRVAGGATITKFVIEIKVMDLQGLDSFNQAEKLMAQKTPQAAEAVRAYDAVTNLESRPWLKKLLQYRRVRALGQAGTVVRATQEWLAVLDEDGASAGGVALQPARLAEKGSQDNLEAISVLEKKLQGLKKDIPYWQAVGQVLMRLYRQEGLDEKADKLAGGLAGKPALPSKPAKGDTVAKGPETPPDNAGAATAAQTQMQAFVTLIRPGQKKEVLEDALAKLQGGMKRYPDSQLPQAMLFCGKAQLLLAQSAAGGAKMALLLDAGLDLMRVVAYYGDAPEAGEALYLAGKVNAALGNGGAARAAYEEVVNRYGDSEAAQQAQAELGKAKPRSSE